MRNPNDFDCKKCREKYCDEDKSIDGSLGVAPYPLWNIEHDAVGEMSFSTCPLPMISGKSRAMIMLFDNYKRGVFYDPSKSYFRQPDFYLSAMRFLEQHHG